MEDLYSVLKRVGSLKKHCIIRRKWSSCFCGLRRCVGIVFQERLHQNSPSTRHVKSYTDEVVKYCSDYFINWLSQLKNFYCNLIYLNLWSKNRQEYRYRSNILRRWIFGLRIELNLDNFYFEYYCRLFCTRSNGDLGAQ